MDDLEGLQDDFLQVMNLLKDSLVIISHTNVEHHAQITFA
jgi:hypothetical protein